MRAQRRGTPWRWLLIGLAALIVGYPAIYPWILRYQVTGQLGARASLLHRPLERQFFAGNLPQIYKKYCYWVVEWGRK